MAADPSREVTVLDLDEPRCANATLAGAKASWLARARQQGLPILPGVVLSAAASLPAIRHGTEALARRGSGGARLEVGRFPLEESLLARVTAAASAMGPALAVRSSSILEGDGKWSGAFVSYLDVALPEIATAIAGCWASAFSVQALARFTAAGIDPSAAPMAVLIQPAIRPEYGGIARLDGNDEIEVVGRKGSPAPLVQGWEPGVRVVSGPGGALGGSSEAVAYLGRELINEVAGQLRSAHRMIGANTCEWGFADGRLALLQLGTLSVTHPPVSPVATMRDPRLIDLARLARRYPGPLGETLVLAWAASDPLLLIEPPSTPKAVPMNAGLGTGTDPGRALQAVVSEAATLTADVWEMPESMAAARAASVLRQARGTHPEPALDCLAGLKRPDQARADRLAGLLADVQTAVQGLRPRGSTWMWHQPVEVIASLLREQKEPHGPRSSVERIGIDRWEPFQAAVVESFGTRHKGVAAAPGVGCGRLCFIRDAEEGVGFRPRDIVVTTHPVPDLAPLLWDAAGLVTVAGSPAAHLFETARSLNVPAVCSVDLSLGVSLAEATGRFTLAVDGTSGLVHSSEW